MKKALPILLLLGAGAAIYFMRPRKTFGVDIIATDKENKAVSYSISAGGKVAAGNYKITDPVYLGEFADTGYWIILQGRPAFDTIEVTLARKDASGGFVHEQQKIITF
jgi:hypothetical protein